MLNVNNKKAIRRLSIRSLRNSKTRNIIAVIAIILTAVLFTSVFSVGMSAIASMQQSTMRQVGTSAHAGFKFLTWQQYKRLLEDPKIRDISYFYMTDATLTNPSIFSSILDGVSPELVEEVEKLDGVTDSGCVYMEEYEHKLNEPALTQARNNLEEFKELVHYPDIIEQSRQMLDEGLIDSHLYGIDPFVIGKMELVEGKIDPEKFATGDYVVATTLLDTGEGKFYDIGDKVTIDFGNGKSKEYEVLALGNIPYALSPQHSHMFEVYFTLPADEYVRQTETTGAMKLAFDVASDRYDEVEQWAKDYCETVNPKMDYRSKSTYVEEFKETQPAGLCTDLCDCKPDVVFYLSLRDRPGTSHSSGVVSSGSAHSVGLLPADEQKKCGGAAAGGRKLGGALV